MACWQAGLRGDFMEKRKFSASFSTWEYLFAGGKAEFSWKEEAEGESLTLRLPYRGAYGMGEKYNALNQKGKLAVNQVEEKFCFQGEKTYCPAPFFWTDTGFGLYVDTEETTAFEFREEEIWIRLPKDCEIVLFSGTPESILREYTGLFGEAILPPRWIFGPWVSANHWDSQEKVEETVRLSRKYGYPVSVLVLEAWSDEATFYIFRGAKYTPRPKGEAFQLEDFDFQGTPWPEPAAMVQRLHEEGIHLLLWQIPVYKKQEEGEEPNIQNTLDREDAKRRGLCVHNQDGSPYTIPEGNWFAGSMMPDFSNPETEESWFAKREYLNRMGVDGYKTDGGEFIYSEQVCFQDGSDGRRGKNRYAQSYTEAYSRHLGKGQILFSRAGFSGQHKTPILWGGDQQSTNEELKSVLTAGLSAALTGIPFWGFDIAGFAGELPTPDLYRRATQLACFCPVMQWHSEPDGGQFKLLMPGGKGNNERSPWNLAAAWKMPELIEEMRFWHLLRMNLIPYLWSTAKQCVRKRQPMMRPLVYDWPEDERAVSCEDEFLLGESLLVAPLLEENAEERKVYLPEGEWIGLFDRKWRQGKQTVTAGGNGKLPVFIRRGRGIVLCLGKDRKLGAFLKKGEGSFHCLLAGSEGKESFEGLSGERITVSWENGRVKMPNLELSYEILERFSELPKEPGQKESL